MASTIQRQASPARWQKAVERAISDGVQVRQLAGSGAWIATSGSDSSAAYELEVTGEIVQGCNCLAGLNGDPVCKHRAAFYLAVGVLDPKPGAPALAPCGYCYGRGWETVVGKSDAEFRFACQVCAGAGTIAVGECEDEPADDAGTLAPAAVAPAAPVCIRCRGAGLSCPLCRGQGVATLPEQAAVLRRVA